MNRSESHEELSNGHQFYQMTVHKGRIYSMVRGYSLDSIFVKGDKNVQTSFFNYTYTRGECFLEKNFNLLTYLEYIFEKELQ